MSTPNAVREEVRHGIDHMPRSARRYLERSFLGKGSTIRELFFENFAVFPAAMQIGALRHPENLLRNDPYAVARAHFEAAPGGTLERMSHADLQTYLVELLMKQDQMSMAASVESRVPFLDHRFVEYAAALPARYKLRGWTTKAVLREALSDVLPRPIIKRRKMGFPTPVAAWLRGAFTPLLDELVLSERAMARSPLREDFLRRMVGEHRSGERRHGDRLWLLMNLEIWQRVFFDGEAPEAVMESCTPRRRPASPRLTLVRSAPGA